MAQELWKKELSYSECIDITGLPEKIIQEIGKALEDILDGTLDVASDIVTASEELLSKPVEISGNVIRETGRAVENVARETGNAAGNVARETGRAAGNVARETGRAAGNVARETRRAACRLLRCKTNNLADNSLNTEFEFFEDLCIDFNAEIALVYDGAFFVRFKVFNYEYSYKLEGVHDNCTEVYNFGLGAIHLCYKDLKFDNDKLKSIRLSVEVKIGFTVKFGDLKKDFAPSQEILNVNVDLV